jgi:hypothetical protein
MTPEQAIGMLNIKAAAAHRAYLETVAGRGDTAHSTACLARHNAILDCIDVVRQIHEQESSHAY